MSGAARRANEGLALIGKTAVMTGASQGIGAGVAVRFAQAGANVIIVGRSEQRLKKVVEDARKAAKSPSQHIEYISADLSLISNVKSVVGKIEASSHGTVDFLVQTQGGTPNGLYETTSEGLEVHFATQVLGRFVIAYQLASSGVLKGTFVNVLAPGGSEKEFNLDDIELASHKSSSRLSQMGQAASRDGVITDSYTKAFQSRFPQLRFFHVFPGFVSTNVLVNQNLPFLIKYFVTYILSPIAALTFGNSVQGYADIPVFLAANEKANSLVEAEGYYLDAKNKKASLSPYALNETNQQKVFEKLKAFLD